MKSSKPTIEEFIDSLNENQREFFEERAAILEYDAGLQKDIAEIEALIQTKRFFHL